MSLNEEFDKAAAQVKNLKQTPKDDQLLELYALFKQATVGDVCGDKPGMLDFKGKAKYEAWGKKKGLSNDDAKTSYVAYVNQLVAEYGSN